jgi:hypothetical protein
MINLSGWGAIYLSKRIKLLGLGLLIPGWLLQSSECTAGGPPQRVEWNNQKNRIRSSRAALNGEEIGLFGPDRRGVSLPDRLNLYRKFGVEWARFNASIPLSPSHGMTDPEEADAFRQTGVHIFLSANSPPNSSQPTFDFSAYRAGASQLMNRYRPDIVAAENEVDNQNYNGAVNLYLNKLNILCQAAHGAGVKCTDSGLTIKMIIALYMDEIIRRGDPQAISSVKALLNEWYGMRRGPGNTVADWQDFRAREHVADADMMLHGLRSSGADFVNLHWYGKTNGSVTEEFQNKYLIPAIVNMLRNKTGLPVIGGEVGVEGASGSDSQLPATSIGTVIRSLKCSGVNLVILWSPGFGSYTANSRALSLFGADGRPFKSASALGDATARSNSFGCS